MVPAGVADVQERRPASNLVDGDRSCRVDSQPLAHLFGVAENGGSLQAVAGDARDGVEDALDLAHTALDRRRHEHLGLAFGGGGTGLDGRLELRPAGEAQLASNDQLGGGQGDDTLGCTRVVAGEALGGAGITVTDGVAQLLGLAAKLVEVGALGERSGH